MPTENTALTTDGNHLVRQSDILVTIQHQIGNWSKWTKQLKDRKKQTTLRKSLGPSLLLWGLPSELTIHQSTSARLIQLKPTRKGSDDFDWLAAVEQWTSAINENGMTSMLAIEAVAWAHAMPSLTTRLDEETWTELLATLLVISQRTADRKADNEVTTFITSTELALTLAATLPELSVCKKKAAEARKQFTDSLDELLDGEGMPHARNLSQIQVLLASCTRTLTLDGLPKKGKIDKPGRLQFDWLCRQVLRWARPNGTPILGSDSDAPLFDELMKAALKITKDDSDVMAFKMLRGKRKKQEDGEPTPSEHSEPAELATMRTSWLPSASRLAVSFADRSLHAELSVGQQVIFSGKCMPNIQVDGQRLEQQNDWEEVCWETDDDMDFIELDCKLTNGWRLQRQFLLARKDGFALVSDALIGDTGGSIRYQHALPMQDGVTLDEQDETTETLLLGEKNLGTVVPISLSEWKSANPTNRLRTDPARLEITQRARALYAPLFIDLSPSRRNKALTWRTLTVAENLQRCANDVAVAFRIQIGKKQWVIYRSLEKPGNRTFLGWNTFSEFIVARFNPDGEIEPLIDVSV